MRPPWTREELDAVLPPLKQQLQEMEDQEEQLRFILPMTLDESREFFLRFLVLAEERQLSRQECILFGQWLAVYESAIRADMLRKKGRYMVLSEDEIRDRTGLL